ncbi:MAG: ABC transporter ATP-binding protein [candidate division Zixibacteria bacterium]|jgi:putative ABC transport system ATP-binding protein|nr:ABC transporter ATP-binding protein [candidate division Zixibacteria bacterium]
MAPVIETHALIRTFQIGDIAVRALRGIDLVIQPGEFVAIMGASGSGKSTLMNLLGCLDTPTSGQYILDGERVDRLSRTQRADVRNRKIGFVFQGFNLLSRTSALENVELPLFYNRHNGIKHNRTAAAEALARVGLGDRLDHTPNQLSGGQQQRVAIARALVNKPSILLADEPTGNLDSATSVEIVALFQDLNEAGVTVILVTHERDIAQYTRRMVALRDGLIVRDEPVNGRRDARADLAALQAEAR